MQIYRTAIRKICKALLLSVISCACYATSGKGWEVIGDISFKRGLALTPLDPAVVQANGGIEKNCVDTFFFRQKNVLPVWRLVQWHNKYDFRNAVPVEKEDGSIMYGNQSKKVIWYPEGRLWLELNAGKEYDCPRKQEDMWPHLLIEQSFPRCPNIGKVKQLDFSMEIKLEKCERRMSDADYNPEIHTAQSPFYFILRNVDEQSADFNSFIWIGIPSYDYRYERMMDKELVSWDAGTSTYIYNLPQLTIWGDITFHDKQWHRAQADLLPLIKEAVQKMKGKGYFKDTDWEDLEITGMNFGWEIPGTFDAAVSIRNISLKVL